MSTAGTEEHVVCATPGCRCHTTAAIAAKRWPGGRCYLCQDRERERQEQLRELSAPVRGRKEGHRA